MEQVLVRFPQLGRDTVLKHAEVVSRNGDELRVKVIGEVLQRTVLAAETVPVAKLNFRTNVDPRLTGSIQKAYPTAGGALGGR